MDNTIDNLALLLAKNFNRNMGIDLDTVHHDISLAMTELNLSRFDENLIRGIDAYLKWCDETPDLEYPSANAVEVHKNRLHDFMLAGK